MPLNRATLFDTEGFYLIRHFLPFYRLSWDFYWMHELDTGVFYTPSRDGGHVGLPQSSASYQLPTTQCPWKLIGSGICTHTWPGASGYYFIWCKVYVNTLQLRDNFIPLIFMLDFSLFTRRYYGNRCYFLFLSLIICLNSGGYTYFNWDHKQFFIAVMIESNVTI